MGCFNIAGFYTNQAISYGMPVIGFLCCEFDIDRKSEFSNHITHLHYAMPLSMPIFGDYNDYGSIEYIKESKVTKALEEYFGYDIDIIVHDVNAFESNKYLGFRSRYDQIIELRKKDPNDSFMKEEFDRYAPIYEKIRDSIELDKTDTLTSFNIFFAIDHAALWDAFITKDSDYNMPDDRAERALFAYPTDKYGYYDNEENYQRLMNIVFSINEEKTMIKDFNWFISNISNNLEFKFCQPKNYSQSSIVNPHLKLAKLLTKAYKEQASRLKD